MKRILGSLAAIVIFFAATAGAQNAQEMAQIMESLPKPAVAVVDQLAELNNLPAGQWRVHTGDIAHGESTSLDDAAWPLTGTNKNFPSEAVWFRQWVEVPANLHGYDLTGARIWFDFSASANGAVPEIIYFNGRRVALGDAMESIVLFENAKPGDKVLVAVKLLATAAAKHFGNATMKIDFADGRPSPEDLRQEFLSAAALLPVVSTNLKADQSTLDRAIDAVNLKALDAGNQHDFDNSLKAAQATLEPLRPTMQKVTVHLTGNSHIDAAWLWPWTETVDVVKRTFSTALQLMNEYPAYTYTQSAAAYNEWMAQKYPAMNDEIKKRIKEGRWEIVGGMWVEPDLNMPDGESTARSILIGKRWYKQNYGVDVHIGWNPDSFGYNWQLPQIYKKSGIDYFVTQKMSWNDTNQLPFKLFWWESPDGSKVLTYFPHGYGNRNLSPARLSADFEQARTYTPGLPEMMDLYGVGDHGGGPTRVMLDEGMHWLHTDKVVPPTEFGTAAPFFASVEKEIAPASPTWDYKKIAQGYEAPTTTTPGQFAVPTWKDELYLEYHRGVFTTQANHKRNMRESSEWALNAEKYASLAWLDGDAYPGEQFTDAWKKITFNQFHDLAAGSGIGVIYKDAQKDYDSVRLNTDEISAKALGTLAARIDTRAIGAVPVLVFNPLGWARSGDVTVDVQMPRPAESVSVMDAAGHVLPSEVLHSDKTTNTFHLLVHANDVPSMGYEVLHVAAEHRSFASDLQVKGTTLENAALRVVVDPKTGCITSLYDKKANFETLAAGACGNVLQTFKDTPKKFDAWNIDPGTLDHPLAELTKADSVEVVERDPMRAVIRVTRTWQKSKFVQQIVLESGADEVEVVNDIDWHETHVLLKTAFALSASGPSATYEIPYGTIERPTTRANTWEQARFEVPALRWADLGDASHGFSLINESKYGYDAVGNLMRLSLLRSPVSPDPDADRGHHHFRYALYPHAGSWKQAMTVRRGYEFNYKLKAMQVESHPGAMPQEHSFVSVSANNVVLTAMKKAEDNDGLIFHMYEWAGKGGNVELTLPPGATGAVETNLLETPQGPALGVTGNRVTVPIAPYEIESVRVDYAPKKQ
ncbi:MAG TPA: glycoside hydrolase family 38 C-terminal domain-containing protein [Acidobacteriaceae bacterium]